MAVQTKTINGSLAVICDIEVSTLKVSKTRRGSGRRTFAGFVETLKLEALKL